MKIQNVSVIGAGVMGQQIAMDAAIHGYDTYCKCFDDQEVSKVQGWADTYLEGRIAKGRMDQAQVDGIKSRFHLTASYEEALKNADLVIEAVPEKENIKLATFKTINEYAPKTALIASNSSYMVSSTFRDCIDDPSRLANMHFYNPALVMKFVEVVKGEHTSDATADALVEYCKSCGKMPALMLKEIPGFIANVIIAAIYDKAWFLVDNGYCTWQDVDLACEKGLGHPMGPFRLLDMTGVKLSYDIKENRYKESGVKPAGYDTLKQMVEEGRYGRTTGRGFYDYDKK